jgi:uncharacterized Zn finger protein
MEIITNRETGLFPKPKEIKLHCSCPDGAYMCKHVAAVLYGVGAHLDQYPQDLFLLRQIDHLELINKVNIASITTTSQDQTAIISDDSGLSALFGIDIKQRIKGGITEDPIRDITKDLEEGPKKNPKRNNQYNKNNELENSQDLRENEENISKTNNITIKLLAKTKKIPNKKIPVIKLTKKLLTAKIAKIKKLSLKKGK